MRAIKKTADYTIFQKKNERYAVKSADKKWINGEEKAKILLAEELIKLSVAQEAPAEEVVEEAAEESAEKTAEVAAEAVTEEAAEEAPAEEESTKE